MPLERLVLEGIGSLIVIVNGGIGLYKFSRSPNRGPFAIPAWLYVYFILSILYVLFVVAFGPLFFEGSSSFGGAGVLNTLIVFMILTEPAQWIQHVRGGRYWQRFARRIYKESQIRGT